MINDKAIDTDIDPYLVQGTSMVPLNVVQQIPGISLQWNNMNKQVTMVRKGITIKLVAGQKTAVIGTKVVLLPEVPRIFMGRVVVPLRFIAELAEAYVIWNANTRSIYIAKASEELMGKIASPNLWEARTAALNFPRVSTLKSIKILNETQNQNYYFPEGISNQFFIQGGPGISYFKVAGNHVEEIWTAKLDNVDKAKNGLPFLPYKIIDQDGAMPSIKGRVAFYHLMLPIMEATYGFIDENSASTTLGQQDMELNKVFEIPGEQ